MQENMILSKLRKSVKVFATVGVIGFAGLMGGSVANELLTPKTVQAAYCHDDYCDRGSNDCEPAHNTDTNCDEETYGCETIECEGSSKPKES